MNDLESVTLCWPENIVLNYRMEQQLELIINIIKENFGEKILKFSLKCFYLDHLKENKISVLPFAKLINFKLELRNIYSSNFKIIIPEELQESLQDLKLIFN